MKVTVTVMPIVKAISGVEKTIADQIFIHWQIVAMIQVKVTYVRLGPEIYI